MKTVQKLAIIVFGIWLLFGVLGMGQSIDKVNFEKQEMREPSTMKELHTYANSKAFFADIEKFLEDRIFLRSTYISLYNALHLENYMAAFSSVSSHILGLDNWIFLGNSYDNVLNYTKNAKQISETEIMLKLENLKKIQDVVISHNIPYVMLVSPNKHTIYEEFLPSLFKPASHFRFADAVLEKAKNESLYFIFPKAEILKEKISAQKNNKRLYLKDDTHWNAYGAFIAFKQTWAMLQQQGDFPNLPDAISIEQIDKQNGGDLIAIGKFSNSYHDPVGYKYALHESKKNSLIKRNHLLVIGDSFTGELMPLYELAFENITRIHWNEVNFLEFTKLIQKLNPDAVIYQVVERSFQHAGIKE